MGLTARIAACPDVPQAERHTVTKHRRWVSWVGRPPSSPFADPLTAMGVVDSNMVVEHGSRRNPLSYRDPEELLAERGIEVDHVTFHRWVQRFTPLLIYAARPVRHLAGDRWFVDETYVKVAGVWRYVYRAVDQHGQVIDVYVSGRRDIGSARTFFTVALTVHGDPGDVITDRAPALANAIEGLIPAAWHNTGKYENNRVECDHGRLKARLRPMRGVKTNRTASVVIRGHAFIQNLRRGHYELAVDAGPLFRLATAFDELRPAI